MDQLIFYASIDLNVYYFKIQAMSFANQSREYDSDSWKRRKEKQRIENLTQSHRAMDQRNEAFLNWR